MKHPILYRNLALYPDELRDHTIDICPIWDLFSTPDHHKCNMYKGISGITKKTAVKGLIDKFATKAHNPDHKFGGLQSDARRQKSKH